MKKYIILSHLESFDFPLREATRKQIWWRAKRIINKGNYVKIIILSDYNKEYFHDGINIKIFNRKKFANYLKIEKCDYIYFINGTISLWFFSIIFNQCYKKLILTDGNIWGNKHILLKKLVSKFLPLLFNEICVYSNYQKKSLSNNLKINIIKPILPKIESKYNYAKTLYPSILYMGHLSYFKGVHLIINAFEQLVKEIPELKWVIADSRIKGDKELIRKVHQLKNIYKNNISIKYEIDPIQELSEAWVYIYPLIEAGGTMAFSLSLYESLKCGTPFISTRVGANDEFFNNKYLIDPNNDTQLIEKIKYYLYGK